MYILNCPGCENEGIYLIGTIENKDGTTDDLFMCDACGTEFMFSEAEWIER